MGTFSTGGIAAEMQKLDKLAKGTDAACSKAVKAGGALLAQRLGEAAPVDTGALAASIKAGAVSYDAGDGWHCEVAPTGENHGENLAKIGNILEYGRSNMPARPWFNPTVDQATGEVTAAMQQAFDQAQKG